MLLIFLGCASKRLVSPRQKGQRRRRGHGAAGDTGHSLPASAAPGRAASPPSSSLTPRPRWQRAKLLPPAHNGSRSHCGTAFCLQQPGCNSQEVSAGEQNRCCGSPASSFFFPFSFLFLTPAPIAFFLMFHKPIHFFTRARPAGEHRLPPGAGRAAPLRARSPAPHPRRVRAASCR